MLNLRSHDGDDSELTQMISADPALNHLRVVIPSLDRDGRPVRQRFLRHRLEEFFVELAGGATTYPGIGVYRCRDGRIQRERVAVVETIVKDPLTIRDVSEVHNHVFWLARQARQECVALMIARGRLLLFQAGSGLEGVCHVASTGSLDGPTHR